MTLDCEAYEVPSRAGKLHVFFDRSLELDIKKITVERFLLDYNLKDFNEKYDREKILSFIAEKAKQFEKEILLKVFCPRCKSSNVAKILDRSGHFKERYRCLDCRKPFKGKGFINSHFSDDICALVFASFAQGGTPQETYKLLVNYRTNLKITHGIDVEIPDEKTLYGILRKGAIKFDKFNRLMIRLIGGIPCRVLYADDAFARKRHRKQQQTTKSKKKWRFYYAILTLDGDSRFIICLHIASSRDKHAFRDAFGKTEERLRTLPETIKGDKYAAMERAAKIFFPTSRVKHVFLKLKVTEKGDLMITERRIKDVRKTIRKRQKYGSPKTLADLATLAVIDLNYLTPMIEALSGKSPAQAVGIPYPFSAYDWRKLMVWVDWIFGNLATILKSGLKQLPGCSLKPSTDSSDAVFNERTKTKKKRI